MKSTSAVAVEHPGGIAAVDANGLGAGERRQQACGQQHGAARCCACRKRHVKIPRWLQSAPRPCARPVSGLLFGAGSRFTAPFGARRVQEPCLPSGDFIINNLDHDRRACGGSFALTRCAIHPQLHYFGSSSRPVVPIRRRCGYSSVHRPLRAPRCAAREETAFPHCGAGGCVSPCHRRDPDR